LKSLCIEHKISTESCNKESLIKQLLQLQNGSTNASNAGAIVTPSLLLPLSPEAQLFLLQHRKQHNLYFCTLPEDLMKQVVEFLRRVPLERSTIAEIGSRHLSEVRLQSGKLIEPSLFRLAHIFVGHSKETLALDGFDVRFQMPVILERNTVGGVDIYLDVFGRVRFTCTGGASSFQDAPIYSIPELAKTMRYIEDALHGLQCHGFRMFERAVIARLSNDGGYYDVVTLKDHQKPLIGRLSTNGRKWLEIGNISRIYKEKYEPPTNTNDFPNVQWSTM